MSEEKFIICPNCGALLENGLQFCGFCGSNIEEKRTTQPQQPMYQQPPPQQPGTPNQNVLGQQPVYVIGEDYTRQEADQKQRLAWIFAWITFCGGSIIFFILTIYFVIEAKKLGSKNPRLNQSIIVAVAGVILSIGITIGLYIWLFSSGFPYFY